MRLGVSTATDHTVGSRRAESLRTRSGDRARRVGKLRRRSPDEARPVAARVQHCPSLKMVDVMPSIATVQGCRSRSVGLGRPRPYGARHALRPQMRTGRGKTGAAIPRGESLPCDPWQF